MKKKIIEKKKLKKKNWRSYRIAMFFAVYI